MGQLGFVQENQIVAEGMVREASKLHMGDQQFEQWPQQQPMHMHPMPMSIAPPSWFHLPNAWARAKACPFVQPSWMTGTSHGGRFRKRMSSGRRNAFLEWMKHVIIFATAFHYLGCILKGIFDNVFLPSLNFEAKREGPVGWRASTFTLLVFVSWFL